MSNESCIHCGQPAEEDDRNTSGGRVHDHCWPFFHKTSMSDTGEDRPKTSIGRKVFRFFLVVVLILIGIVIFGVLALFGLLDNIFGPTDSLLCAFSTGC
jgi:hypothetical protein